MATEAKVLRSLDEEFAARNLREAGAMHISCAANMQDLRPAVDGILARVDQVSAHLREGQKLVVLVGETHAIASHRVLQAQLIARIHDQVTDDGMTMAAGFELPHDFAALKMRHMKISPLSPLVQDHFERQMGSAGLISAFLDDNPLMDAPQSKSFLLHNIGARGISMRFHDVAVSYKSVGSQSNVPCLDENDTATRTLIDTVSSEEVITCESPLGMKLRNDFMVQNIQAHIREANPDIYVHMAGSAHVLGDHAEGYAYEDSLHKQLQDQGYAVLSVLPIEGGGAGMHYWWNSMLSNAAQDDGLPDIVIVTDMVRQRLYYKDADKERQLIKTITSQSCAQDIMRPVHQKDWKRQVGAFKNEVPRWIEDAKKSCRDEILARNAITRFKL